LVQVALSAPSRHLGGASIDLKLKYCSSPDERNRFPEDWLYSSMRNYVGLPALIEIEVSDF
jgi:hypothetical protein